MVQFCNSNSSPLKSVTNINHNILDIYLVFFQYFQRIIGQIGKVDDTVHKKATWF